MTEQISLLAPPPEPPAAVTDFLSGFAARYAYGEKPTEQQKRAAARVGLELAARLAQLRADAQ